jgi:hypothetical protein
MAKTAYKGRAFKPASLLTIRRAEAICAEYAEQGYDLTLRQLYYQFVARDLLPNTQQSYNNLGNLISDARMAGLLDWDHIVDRTRAPKANAHWTSPSEVLRSAAYSYSRDKWVGQTSRVEVWVEKEALAGVVARSASALDCTHFSCRGYVSQSAMWRAAQRITDYLATPKVERVVILHLGDHDPSGIDMTRDIKERLGHFIGVDYAREKIEAWDDHHRAELSSDNPEVRAALQADVDEYMNRLEIRRIALNMDQIDEYAPPPNPAKLTDARAAGYVATHGYESWELDALPPDVLDELIRGEIEAEIDDEAYQAEVDRETAERDRLYTLAREWGRSS